MINKEDRFVAEEKELTKEQKKQVGALITGHSYHGTLVIEAFDLSGYRKKADLLETLQDIADRVKAGDLTDVESMLVSQAVGLQGVYTNLIHQAANQKMMAHYQAFMSMALKCQNQCRTTIQTLLDLKFPRTTAFVKQTNITTGPQQVNNGTQPESVESGAEEKKTEQSKLSLEDTRHERQGLDNRAASTTSGTNSELATVEKIHRAKKPKRKG